MIPPGFMWKTNDSRVLDIRWMDSAHLVNSFNMLCRKHSLSAVSFDGQAPVSVHNILGNMADELRARGHFNWASGFDQIVVPKARENVQVLCMFRALVDHAMPSAARAVLLGHTAVEPYLTMKDPSWAPILASFAAYRLERP